MMMFVTLVEFHSVDRSHSFTEILGVYSTERKARQAQIEFEQCTRAHISARTYLRVSRDDGRYTRISSIGTATIVDYIGSVINQYQVDAGNAEFFGDCKNLEVEAS